MRAANEGRREAEHFDAVALDQRPQPIGTGEVGGTLVYDTGGPKQLLPKTSHGPIIQPMSVIQ